MLLKHDQSKKRLEFLTYKKYRFNYVNKRKIANSPVHITYSYFALPYTKKKHSTLPKNESQETISLICKYPKIKIFNRPPKPPTYRLSLLIFPINRYSSELFFHPIKDKVKKNTHLITPTTPLSRRFLISAKR